jgi:hypothetical protein
LAENLPSQTPQPQFKVLPKRPFSFAASVKKFSPDQQEIEELTDEQDHSITEPSGSKRACSKE